MKHPEVTAPVFSALGDPTRLGIVARLCACGPLPTISLIAGTEMSRQAITKHLRALQEVGIVRSNRVGRDRVWQLRTRRFAEIRSYLEEISAQWDATLARLRAFVEEE